MFNFVRAYKAARKMQTRLTKMGNLLFTLVLIITIQTFSNTNDSLLNLFDQAITETQIQKAKKDSLDSLLRIPDSTPVIDTFKTIDSIESITVSSPTTLKALDSLGNEIKRLKTQIKGIHKIISQVDTSSASNKIKAINYLLENKKITLERAKLINQTFIELNNLEIESNRKIIETLSFNSGNTKARIFIHIRKLQNDNAKLNIFYNNLN